MCTPHLRSCLRLAISRDSATRRSWRHILTLFQGRVNLGQDQKGHISNQSSRMLRFFLVNAAYMVIKYSKKMKVKYLRLVRGLGKNSSIVAIAWILAETVRTMLSKL